MNKSKEVYVMSTKKKNKKPFGTYAIIAGAAAAVVLGVIILTGGSKKAENTKNAGSSVQGTGIVITKSEVTDKASFIPYKADGTKLEVIAVKASDGTVRTAFNTCQVCFNSGRGYYVQEGDELVCQNCGNRFNIDQIEKQKNGCNPVPILDEDKTDDGTAITIADELLKQAAPLFSKWKA
jgi:hypothetical protein